MLNNKTMFIVILISVLLMLGGVLYFYNIKPKDIMPSVLQNNTTEVLKEYHAPDNSFSFKYPEFPGWEFHHLSEDGYTVFLHDPTLGKTPGLEIELPQIVIRTADPLIASPLGFKEYYKESNQISIAAPTGWLLTITLPNRGGQGFSYEHMAEVIMDTVEFKH